jgi:hypothetical protein
LAPSRSYSTSGVSRLNWICFAPKWGNSNEKDNRECGTFSSSDVFDSDGRGANRRRCVGGLIGCRCAWANRCRRRSFHRLDGRPVDFAFVGSEPLKRATLRAESRKPRRSCPSRRQSTCAQSVCAQRSSSSSSGRPSAAVRHHHGFHRAAGPATGVSVEIGARGFGPAPSSQAF